MSKTRSFGPISGMPTERNGWHNWGSRTRIDSVLMAHLEASVYRYASLAEALALTRGGRWSFARPTAWSDRYETHVSDELFSGTAVFAKFPGFVKCLSFEYSSEAMWRIYATTGGLVRMSWKLSDLLALLDNADWSSDGKIYVGPVRYMNAAEIRDGVAMLGKSPGKRSSQHAMRALLMKRSGFGFENELRIVFFPADGPSNPFHTASRLSINTMQRILIDPYLPPWQAEEIRATLKDVLKVPCDVRQSAFAGVYGGGLKP